MPFTFGLTNAVGIERVIMISQERLPGAEVGWKSDSDFLRSIGVEAWEADLFEPGPSRSTSTVLIHLLAILQFIAIAAGLVWTGLRLT